MTIDFVRPAVTVCIKFSVLKLLCELRRAKSELSGDGLLGNNLHRTVTFVDLVDDPMLFTTVVSNILPQ